MIHPVQDLAGLARQILGHSLVVFFSHHDEARLAAPDDADAVIAEMNALAAQRLATASDEDLRRRKMVLLAQYQNAADNLRAYRGFQSARRPGYRSDRIWRDQSAVNKAAQHRAEGDKSQALGEREEIQKEIDRRANAQAARA